MAARQTVELIDWYNHTHRHSSLEGHTPASVHDGSWVQIHHQRQATLDALYQANPGRLPPTPASQNPHGPRRPEPTTTPRPTPNRLTGSERVGFGFRTFRNYRIRVLLDAGGVNWNLLPTLTPR